MVKRVPKYVRHVMEEILELNIKSFRKMEWLEKWLESHGIDTGIEGLRDGSGVGLDELEYCNDCIDALCCRIENMDDYSNKMKEGER